MSIPTKEQASRFLAPLRGNIAIILLHDVQAKSLLSRFMLRCATMQSTATTVLDADAFYSTNMDRLAEAAQPITRSELLLLPERDFEVSSLLTLLSSKREMLIIDDLNSLYSLASDGRKLQQLTILMKMLSLNARVNSYWVIATAYRAEQGAKQGGLNQRSLTALGDMVVDTDFSEGSLRLRTESNGRWPNNELEV
ncbi:MAG: hypothetical protein OK441_05400 [Thaumarchaeota archaeon]|nr:hypothetical protein [Nitrososphaerota archaeon]